MRRDRARRPSPLAPALVVAFLLALLVGAVGAASAGAVATTTTLKLCPTAELDHTLCGRVNVPLDRTGAVPGTVGLKVRTLPPADGATSKGDVLALAGGPGQAATPLISGIAGTLRGILRDRTLVTFDQRGTGGSGLLKCNAIASSESPTAIGACASQLGAKRADYTTADSVQDLEAVRQALGIDRLVLVGTSYGTKVALDYAAAFPQHVARLVLDSAVPLGGVDPFDRTTLASIPRVLRTVCARSCPFTRDVVGDLRRLVQQVQRRPLRGEWFDPLGHAHHDTVDGLTVLELILSSDVNPYLRADLPAAIRAGLGGDGGPLLRLAGATFTSPGDFSAQDSDALFIATTCEDGSVPWATGTPVAQRLAATDATFDAIPSSAFAPFGRALVRKLGTIDLCRGWPEAPVAQPSVAPPDVPTLILSGNEDLRTPRFDAFTLARQLPAAQVVEVPQTGHNVLGSEIGTSCASAALDAFVAGRKVPACKRPVRREPPVAPVAPRRLAEMAGVRGLPAKVGETLNALGATIGDFAPALDMALANDAPPVAGGLRGGSVSVDARGFALARYSYVPGVTVTGHLAIPTGGEKPRPAKLTIGGSAAARGTVTLDPRTHRISGTLGGRRFALTLRQANALGRTTSAARDAVAPAHDAARAGTAAAVAGGPALHLPAPALRALLY